MVVSTSYLGKCPAPPSICIQKAALQMMQSNTPKDAAPNLGGVFDFAFPHLQGPNNKKSANQKNPFYTSVHLYYEHTEWKCTSIWYLVKIKIYICVSVLTATIYLLQPHGISMCNYNHSYSSRPLSIKNLQTRNTGTKANEKCATGPQLHNFSQW